MIAGERLKITDLDTFLLIHIFIMHLKQRVLIVGCLWRRLVNIEV